MQLRSIFVFILIAAFSVNCRVDAEEYFAAKITGKGYSVREFSQLVQAENGYRAFLSPVFLSKGGFRKARFGSSLGSVLLLAQTGVRQNLGWNEDALAAEALTLSYQAMAERGFPEDVFSEDFPWRIVLLRSVPERVSRQMLSSSRCHAAWMGPPATIVVAVDRLRPGCYGQMQEVKSRKDALRGILLHEIGHAVEFRLLGRAFGRRQRWHSEGFAQWFELHVREAYSGKNELVRRKLKDALQSFDPFWRAELFRGSKEDYLASYIRVAFIAKTYGVSGLLEIYRTMSENNWSFSEAVENELGFGYLDWAHNAKLAFSEPHT